MAEIKATTFTLGLVQMQMATEPDENLKPENGDIQHFQQRLIKTTPAFSIS
ncbi:MAG: hypothetical protein ACREJN_07015 [Nitrospiraceae bacterium]